MSAIERWLAYGAIVLLLATGAVFYLEHRGAEACIQGDKTVVDKAEVHNTQVEATQSAADEQAEKTLNATLSTPVGDLPPVPASMQQPSCPSPVPHPRGNPVPSAAAAPVRAEAPASVVQPQWHSLEQSDVQSGRDADAQVIYLQGLLVNRQKACGGK